MTSLFLHILWVVQLKTPKGELSMKTRFCAALLLAVLSVTLFTGCAVHAQDRLSISAEPTPAATPAATGPSRTLHPYLSREEAKTIALTHAGVSAKEADYLTAEFDYDNGQPKYEVEFYHNGYEYDYEIHAENGKIIAWDKAREI